MHDEQKRLNRIGHLVVVALNIIFGVIWLSKSLR